jgi:hypothetical protein
VIIYFTKYFVYYKAYEFTPVVLHLAGDGSLAWNTLFSDFIIVAEKLEQLGFSYCYGEVIEPV